jgi:hypothetical protein
MELRSATIDWRVSKKGIANQGISLDEAEGKTERELALWQSPHRGR